MCSIIVTILLITTGCGAKKQSAVAPESATAQNQTSDSSTGFGNGNTSNEQEKSKGNSSQSIQTANDRKIIKSAAVTLQTLKFDSSLNEIIEKTKESGGYVESSNVQGRRIEDEGNIENRTAMLVLRIPKVYFENFLLDIGTFGNVINKNTSGKDVTGEYFDTEAHLKSLKIQEDRLLEILKKTGELKDIIELERELTNVRYQIENLTGTLKKWDNLIDYSTLTIEIHEVQEIHKVKEKPISILGQMDSAFTGSIKLLINLFKMTVVLIAASLPFIVIALVVLFIIIKISKRNIGSFILRILKAKDNKNEDNNNNIK
jgi:hypothetical protein